MRTRFRFLLVCLTGLLLPVLVRAQDPAPTPLPTPGVYPDIESLREPGSTAKLFPPPGASPTPAADDGPVAGNGRRNNPLLNHGQHRRNLRTNDMLGDLADNDPLEVRVAYRRAKTTVMARDPELAELLVHADAAGTDVQKRALLKVYYTRLFAEVCRVDRSPEMKKHVELLGQVSQQRYDPQRRAVGGEEDIVRGGGGGRRGRAQ